MAMRKAKRLDKLGDLWYNVSRHREIVDLGGHHDYIHFGSAKEHYT